MSALAPPAPAGRRAPTEVPRPHRALGLAVLAVVVGAFALFSASRMLPPQPYGLADDWRVFYAAASVTHHGGSPYDPVAMHAAEQEADRYPAVQPSLDDFANLPIVAWGLQPFTLLPFWVSFAVITALGLVAAGAALALWLRRSGWRGWVRWPVAALASWPALVGVYSGQFDLLLLALLIGACVLAGRRRPALAGLACGVALLVKPHLLWPLPLLLVAAQLPDRRAAARSALSAVGTVVAGVAAGELVLPGSTAHFVTHLVGFGSRIGTSQPDLAGLGGMLQRLPLGAVPAAAMAVAGAAATVTFAVAWGRSRRAHALPATTAVPLCAGVGLALWLVASPYSHPNDDVLLFPLLALLVGRDAARLRARHVARAMVACAALIAVFLLSFAAGLVAAAAIAAGLWRWRREVGSDGLAAAALVGLAILPMVWPFHVVPVSLTPLAVLVVAAAGAAHAHASLQRVARADGAHQFPRRIPSHAA